MWLARLLVADRMRCLRNTKSLTVVSSASRILPASLETPNSPTDAGEIVPAFGWYPRDADTRKVASPDQVGPQRRCSVTPVGCLGRTR